MSIDWSKAPEGATHWDPGLNCRVAGWMRLDGQTWYWWPAETAYSCPKKWHESLNQHKVNSEGFTERPTLWDGKGLPPVGVPIEAKHKNAQPDWARPGFYETVIVAIGKQLVIFEADGNGSEKVGKLSDYIFRPIRTTEQIAAEERAATIKTILADAGVTDSAWNDDPEAEVWAAALYDAGYRKQVQP